MDDFKECVEEVKKVYVESYEKHKDGSAILGFVGGDGYGDYDYIPVSDEIESILYNLREECVKTCLYRANERIDQKRFIKLWKNFPFIPLICTSVLSLEYMVKANDTDLLSGYTPDVVRAVLLSGSLDSIHALRSLTNSPVYEQLYELVYLCWLSASKPELFSNEVVKRIEVLLLWQAVHRLQRFSKGRKSRVDYVKEKYEAGLRGGTKRGVSPKKQDFIKAYLCTIKHGIAKHKRVSTAAKMINMDKINTAKSYAHKLRKAHTGIDNFDQKALCKLDLGFKLDNGLGFCDEYKYE